MAAFKMGFGGNSITISREVICSVRNCASRCCIERLSILSGCNCRSIHLSTPIAATVCASPGRGPNVRRSSACTARRCSSAAFDSLDLLFAVTTAERKSASSSPVAQCLRGIMVATLLIGSRLHPLNRSGRESCWLEKPGSKSSKAIAQTAKAFHLQQAAVRYMVAQLVALQHPSVVVGHEHSVQTRLQRRIDVRFRAVADHPSEFANQPILLHN